MNLVEHNEWGEFISLHKIPYEHFDGDFYEMTDSQYKYFETVVQIYLYM